MVAEFSSTAYTGKSLPRNRRLNDQHYNALVTERGLDPEWVRVNCYSFNAKEAGDRLGYTAKSDGIMLEGAGIQVQFRPDKPWRNDNAKEKAPKYRSPLGDYDAMVPNHAKHNFGIISSGVPKSCEKLINYCKKLAVHFDDGDDTPYVAVTEGFFKAIAGWSIGVPTIALLGVEMGLTAKDEKGERHPVPLLQIFKDAGFGFIIAFDADCATNPNVVAAQRKLALALASPQNPIRIITGLWTVDQGKGMDDYIQKNGADKFKREILAKAVDIARWERQLSSIDFGSENRKKKPAPPTPRQAGLQIAEEYQPHWAFHNEQKVWRIYNGKYWEEIEEEAFHQVVFNTIEARGIDWKIPSYIDNVIRVLKDKLLVQKWNTFDRTRYIAFNNLVLDTSTNQTLEHSSGFRFTSCLPYDYNVAVNIATDPVSLLSQLCPNIYEFFMRAMNGEFKRVMKLLAVVNGALKFRFHDLQYLVHLVGRPGTGKGTFSRILEKLIGKQNSQNSSLTALDEGTEIAAIIDKQLVIFPDERRQVGVETLLKLTGGDAIRYREIYKKRSEAHFYGLLLVLSNNPIFAGDTTGIERRLSLIHFLNPIPKHLRSSNVEKLYESEIPNLITVALHLKDSEVTSLIKGLQGDEIPEFKQKEWQMKMQVNSVAAWANEYLVYDPDAKTIIGDGRKSENSYDTTTLYGNYRDYCEASGVRQTFQLQTFSAALTELCTDLLEWEGVEKKRFTSGMHLTGVRLRQETDEHIPRIDEAFLVNNVDQCRPSEDPGVDPKPLSQLDYVDHVDLSEQLERAKSSPPPTCRQPSSQEKERSQVYMPTQPICDKGLGSTSDNLLGLHSPIQSQPITVKWRGEEVVIPVEFPDINGFKGVKKEPKKIKARLLAVKSREEYEEIMRLGERALWVIYRMLTEYERQELKRKIRTNEQGRQMSFDEVPLVASEPKSPFVQLVDRLAAVKTEEEFWQIAEEQSDTQDQKENFEGAIYYVDDNHQKNQLLSWWKQKGRDR